MAIQDVSQLNTLIANGIREAKQPLPDVGIFSGGTMPQETKNAIDNLVAKTLAENTNVPSELYTEVANLMVGTTPGMNVDTLSNVLQQTGVFGKIEGALPSFNIENSVSQISEKYTSKVREIAGSIDAAVGKFGLPGFAQNAANGQINQVQDIINSALANTGLTDLQNNIPSVSEAASAVIAQVLSGNGEISLDKLGGVDNLSDTINNLADAAGSIDLSDMSTGQLTDIAGEVLENITGLNASNMKGLSDLILPTVTEFQTKEELEVVGPAPYEIGSGNLTAGGTFISSVEELEAEMGGMTRDISEIIVHWSETFTNANLTAGELDSLTGAGASAYHLIIKRDGSIERGVDMNSAGSHTPQNGHNAYSIGVCLVGGVNVASGNENIVEETSPRSITRSQWNSLYQIFRTFFNQYPGGQALGHMDVDPSQEDPGFDVRDYVYNNFNKQSLYMDPENDPALSPSDIIAKSSGQLTGAEQEKSPFELEKDPDLLEKKF